MKGMDGWMDGRTTAPELSLTSAAAKAAWLVPVLCPRCTEEEKLHNLSMFKGEFSINTARNCVCWLKKLSASFYKCLLFWTVLYILLMRYAWEVKRSHSWNCNYTFFLNSCLIWRGGKEKSKPKQPKQKRWRVFGTLRVGNKWSPVNQITKLLPLMSRKNKMSFIWESFSWGLELARVEVQNEILLLVWKFLMLFNVSMFLSQFGIFTLLISGPVWATGLLGFCFYSLCEVVEWNTG